MIKPFAFMVSSIALALSAAYAQSAPPPPPAIAEGDFIIRDFTFRSGETLRELRVHFATIGAPMRDASGRTTNAVLILHGTGGSGKQFLRPQFAGELFGPGQLLDAKRYFIILPDDIGAGKSSKPSDGLHARFPHYDYDDMVEAEHRLVTAGLGVRHLRLIMGTSMGCMHAFVWGETFSDAADALMPLACLPVAIAGRNRLWRDMVVEAIRADPAWRGGEYLQEPLQGLRTAADLLSLAGSAPQQMQKAMPTGAAADQYLADYLAQELPTLDANDLIYQVEASRHYDPSPRLEQITARTIWINSADDFINPPELGIAEREAARLKRGRFVLLAIGENTHGHGTHTWAVAWKSYLAELLEAPP